MKVAVLIPDRGDRPEFLKNCLRMMEAQTLQPVEIMVMNDPAQSDAVDITWRYRVGYQRLCGKDYDLIAFIENDDWYSPKYLEKMVEVWNNVGRPVLFGTNYTIYYHLKLRRYFTMYHDQRASAMNTMIRPNYPGIDWGQDHNPYTDLQLWTVSLIGKGLVWQPKEHYSVGMKHGVGKCGGFNHIDFLERFEYLDNGFLKATLDAESYEFYNNLEI